MMARLASRRQELPCAKTRRKRRPSRSSTTSEAPMKMKLATVKVLSNKDRKVQREARMLRLITMLS